MADPQLPDLDEGLCQLEEHLIKLLEQDGMDKNQSLDQVKTGPWEERRVLEMILFGDIIRSMATSAGVILDKAQRIVAEQKRKLEERLERLQDSRTSKREHNSSTQDDIDYHSFLLTRNEFRKFQAQLQMIHEDFAKAKPIRNDWLNRENDRQAEQLRWTFSDSRR
ncbi:hypothetical protein BDP55DRAFT_3121 [Colletotrichum godetiae]|uniref:Uncharacterized protein n=1 Tax=Colletotrichum godetiae TaxID=1209918 RepID=A0AAJ0AZ08_9PEZI|nr:uncharacterized protein BDP55DRAFT_3121 [Colletotrichum godetiae]KAK1700916.1 hypothetical protein BDP55DRAFT_3121 [Colletotrichum godetiae]